MFTPVVGIVEGQLLEAPDSLRFNPTNWNIGAPPEVIEECSQFLVEWYEQCKDYENDDNWHDEFRSRAYQVIVRSLESLKEDGFFEASEIDAPFVTVWVVDSDIPNIRGRAWAKRLNSQELYEQFIGWLDNEYSG